MNDIILNQVVQNQGRFLSIFTPKQIAVIEKIQKAKSLSKAERKAFYVGIRPKFAALETLQSRQLYLRGDILPGRIREAQEIIRKFPGKEVFIAGSFLTEKRHNDIDIYMLRARGYSEEHQDNLHIIHITPKHLAKPIIQSAAMTSVGTFNTIADIDKPRLKLDNLMSIYHEAIIEMLEKRDKKEAVRDLVFLHALHIQDRLIDNIELRKAIQKTNPAILSDYFRQLCEALFSKSYLYVHIHDYLKDLRKTAETVKNNTHLITYIETYQRMLYAAG